MPDKRDRIKTEIIKYAMLIAALLLAPLILRITLVLDGGITPGLYDLRGVFSDLAVSLILAVLFYSLASIRSWIGLSLVLLWSIANYGSYEHIMALDALPGLFNINYLTDATFLKGSALTVSRPLVLAVSVIGSFALGWPALKGRKNVFKFTATLMIPFAVLAGIVLMWEKDSTVLTWRQANFISENLRLDAFKSASGLTDETAGIETNAENHFVAADLTGTPVTALNNPGMNVLLIMLESVSGAYLDTVSKAHGVKSSIRMPNLERLAKKNMVYNNFISNQRQTINGEYAILCGDFPHFGIGTSKVSEIVMSKREPSCLPAALRDAGYETVYTQPAPMEFMLKDRFMPMIGFSKIYANRFFKDSYSRNYWGVDDRSFFEQSVDIIQKLEAKDKPWFLTMLTVGTHDPYNVPPDYVSSYEKGSYGEAVSYLDEAFGDFIASLEDKGLLKNTLVVITSDESYGIRQGNNDLIRKLSQNWGVLIVKLPDGNHLKIDQNFMQVDLAASILDYLGLEDKKQGFKGRSVFRSYETKRPVFFSNAYLRFSGAVDVSDNLYLCDEDFSRCDKFRLQDARLFNPVPQSESPKKSEMAFLKEMVLRSRTVSDRSGISSLKLANSVPIPIRNGATQRFFDGQLLPVPAGTRIDVDLDFEALGGDGLIQPVFDMLSKILREGKDIDPFRHHLITFPPMKQGDRVTLKFSYYTDKALYNSEYRVYGRKVWGNEMELKFIKADLKLTPSAIDTAGEPGVREEEITFNSEPLDENGMTEKTIDAYRYSLKANPENIVFNNLIGINYAKLGMLDRAIEYFELGLEIDKNDVNTHRFLARAFKLKGMENKAGYHQRISESLSDAAKDK